MIFLKVEKNDVIKVEYTGKLADGTVFDSSEKQGQPLEFEVGAGNIIKGFDEAVQGMEKGEEKEIEVKKDDAYGDRKEDFVQKIPKDQMPQDVDVKPGMVLAVKAPTGQEFPATVTEVGDSEVTIDMNPPLAGKDLNFKLKVVDIQKKE